MLIISFFLVLVVLDMMKSVELILSDVIIVDSDLFWDLFEFFDSCRVLLFWMLLFNL